MRPEESQKIGAINKASFQPKMDAKTIKHVFTLLARGHFDLRAYSRVKNPRSTSEGPGKGEFLLSVFA